jgi:hypothetical protein
LHSTKAVDFVRWLSEHLADDPSWRQDIASGLQTLKSEYLEDEIKVLTAKLQETLAQPDLAERFAAALASRQNGPSNFSLPIQAGIGTDVLKPDTTFLRPLLPRMFWQQLSTDGVGIAVRIQFGSRILDIDRLTTRFMERLVESTEITGAGMLEALEEIRPTWEDDVEPLAIALVQEGRYLRACAPRAEPTETARHARSETPAHGPRRGGSATRPPRFQS